MKDIKVDRDHKLVKITIDNEEFLVPEGMNLVDAARENGIFIPSLCYFEHIEPPLGTCRTCTCKINGKYAPACTEKVKDGLSVQLNTAELTDIRKALVEMMFSEGNHFCPACEKSGNCDLQHMGYELGISTSRFPHLFKDRLLDYTPQRMVLENNRCIKCRRCVEEVFTDDGQRVFMYQNRGLETIVGIDQEQEAKLSEAQAVAAMRLCPTGAIIVRGHSLAQPFGDRAFDLQSAQRNYSLSPEDPTTSQPLQPLERKVIATVSLAGCFGCHMSILDIDTDILDVAEVVSFHKSPLTDFKDFSTRCHLGLVEGSCCNEENIETLKAFREMCDVLVSVGECAIWGGLPAMRNTIPLGECLEEAYINSVTNEVGGGLVPYHDDLPKLLDRVYACNEIVKMDYYIPGCPPSASHIWKAVKSILWNEPYSVLYHEFKYD